VVIDTSAVAAILFDEPEQVLFARLIGGYPVRLMSAVSRVEATCVVEGRKGEASRLRLERFLALTRAEVASVGAAQVKLACGMFRRFGKGRHPAALNVGDCFA
jgi:ribonuclease VapC